MPYKTNKTRREASYKWSAERRQKACVAMKAWRDKDPGWADLSKCLTKRHITLDQYHAMAEKQDWQCAICGEETKLVIDHDHKTDRFRGLLCQFCNCGIGNLRDDAQRMIAAASYVS